MGPTSKYVKTFKGLPIFFHKVNKTNTYLRPYSVSGNQCAFLPPVGGGGFAFGDRGFGGN